MAIIEYRCTSCGKRFEKLERNSAGGGVECPACGCREVEKEVSSFSSSASSPGCAPAPGGG